MADVQILVEMGFKKERAEYALKVTNYNGVEPAMEWLLAHAEEEIPAEDPTAEIDTEEVPKPDVPEARNSGGEEEPSASDKERANSLKCDTCGKLCDTRSDVEFHAVRTGHHGFSESNEEKKPLTDEEKKDQLRIIEEKLKQKRIAREKQEQVDALEREKNRIKSGKDMTEARKRMEEMEMKKIVDQRKREKADEKAARDRVRSQIEADKAARKAREENQKNQAVGVSSTTSATSPPAMATIAAPTGDVKPANKDYTHTRIQIRLQDGSTLTETFNVKEQLSAVRVFIQVKTGVDQPFGLMTTFPRKVFTEEDYEAPLDVLGLVPSAVIIMTKPTA